MELNGDQARFRRRDEPQKVHKGTLDPGHPLVFTDASKVWKANGTFTPEWFRKNYGDRRTVVDDTEYTMNEILDLVEGKDTSRPVPYPCKYQVVSQLPEVLPMLKPLGLNYATPNWLESPWFARGEWGGAIELFIGGPGGKFPYIHLDYYHLSAWIDQLYGKKQFTVWPRGQEKYLYPDPNNTWKSSFRTTRIPITTSSRFTATPRPSPSPWGRVKRSSSLWHLAHRQVLGAYHVHRVRPAERAQLPAFPEGRMGFRRNNKLKALVHTSYAAVAGTACKLGDMVGVRRG